MKAKRLFLLSCLILSSGLLYATSKAAPKILAGPLLQGSGSFVDSGQTLGQDANDVALGDVDGDGDLDAAVAYNETAKVWLNQGDGTFVDSGQSLGNQLSLAVTLADVDNDGDLDAFVIENDSTGNAVWINQGGAQGGTAGAFASNGQSVGDDLSSDVALGDLDGDNDLDAFVTRNVGRPDKVWLNNGSGQFSDSGQTLGSNSSIGLDLGDVDGDGDLDVMAAEDTQTTLWINQGGMQGGSEGTFTASGQSLPGNFTISVALGDVDRDDDLDVVSGNVNGSNHLWLNQGGDQGGTEGNFLDSGQNLGPNNNRQVVLVDVEVDGDLDLFVARNGPNTVWINQGGIQSGTAGQFQDSGQTIGDLYSLAADLGDLDGDNDPDALVANYPGPTQVWLNQEVSGLETLYRVRDNVLAPTTQGQHYIDLFYGYNSELLSLLLNDPALFEQGYDTVVLWLPNLGSLVNGPAEGSPVITAEQVDAVDDFLTAVSAVASPALQTTISQERAALPPPDDFVGMTMTEAREIVVGVPMLYLPAVVSNTTTNGAVSTNDKLPTSVSLTNSPNNPQGNLCVFICLFFLNCN